MLVIPLLLLVASPYVFGNSLKFRLNQRGSDYFTSIARDVLDKEIRGKPIPDFNGKGGGFHFETRNTKLDEFSLPRLNLTFQEGGIHLTTSGGFLKGSLRFCAKKRIIFKVTQCGNGNFDMDGVNIQIMLKLRLNSEKPQLDMTSCSAAISGASVKLHGNIIVKIANMFRGKIAKVIKSAVEKQACPMLTKVINEKVNPEIADIPSVVPIGGRKAFSLEYSNLKTEIGQNFLEGSADVTFNYTGGKCHAVSENSFDEGLPNKMLTFWLSSKIPSCLLTAFHKTSQLQYTLDNNTALVAPFLRTSCAENGLLPQCIGEIFPVLRMEYFAKSVELRIYSATPPQIVMNSRGIQLTAVTKINVTIADVTDTLAQFNINVSATILPSLQGNRIVGNVTVDKTEMRLVFSKIGEIDETLIELAQKPIAHVATKLLKPIAEKGFELKKFMGSRIAESSGISVLDGFMRLDMDLEKLQL